MAGRFAPRWRSIPAGRSFDSEDGEDFKARIAALRTQARFFRAGLRLSEVSSFA